MVYPASVQVGGVTTPLSGVCPVAGITVVEVPPQSLHVSVDKPVAVHVAAFVTVVVVLVCSQLEEPPDIDPPDVPIASPEGVTISSGTSLSKRSHAYSG